MSSIQRYKRAGGFLQLVSLIETFSGQKREKFIEMVEAESKVWARALREKMLSVERILAWPEQSSIEVFKGLPLKNMAVVFEGIKPEQRDRLMVFFSASEKRRLADELVEKPKPEEISANLVKLVEMARKMLVGGELRAEKIEESLIIPEDFEAKLEAQDGQAYLAKMTEAGEAPTDGESLDFSAVEKPHPSPAAATKDHSGPSAAEVQKLQQTLAMTVKENKMLKEEVRVLREKLEQVRRAAA